MILSSQSTFQSFLVPFVLYCLKYVYWWTLMFSCFCKLNTLNCRSKCKQTCTGVCFHWGDLWLWLLWLPRLVGSFFWWLEMVKHFKERWRYNDQVQRSQPCRSSVFLTSTGLLLWHLTLKEGISLLYRSGLHCQYLCHFLYCYCILLDSMNIYYFFTWSA